MPGIGTCDQCNDLISKGGGYAFFSSASIVYPGMQQGVGNMMLCERCTNQIITPENWAKKIPKQREMSGEDILGNPMALHDMITNSNADSIVQNCKARGFTPEEARAKARELAMKWWEQPEAASIECSKFWSSPPPKPKTSGEKKWWQFWR